MRHNWKRLIVAYLLAPAVAALACALWFCLSSLFHEMTQELVDHGNLKSFLRMVIFLTCIIGAFAYLGLLIAIPLSAIMMHLNITHVTVYVGLGIACSLIITAFALGNIADMLKVRAFIFASMAGGVPGLFFWWFYVRHMLGKQEAVA